MPAISKSQQMAAGVALAAKRGKMPMARLRGAARTMAKMPAASLREFAKTKRKGLPLAKSQRKAMRKAAFKK